MPPTHGGIDGGVEPDCRHQQRPRRARSVGEKPFVESLGVEEIADLPKAQIVVEAERIEYNTFRPQPVLARAHRSPVR
jgi:hypothetical protein